MLGRYVLSLTFMALLTSPAYAYLDPGSGSALMSVVIGFFVAIGLVLKTYWYKLKSLFRGSPTQQSTDVGEGD